MRYTACAMMFALSVLISGYPTAVKAFEPAVSILVHTQTQTVEVFVKPLGYTYRWKALIATSSPEFKLFTPNETRRFYRTDLRASTFQLEYAVHFGSAHTIYGGRRPWHGGRHTLPDGHVRLPIKNAITLYWLVAYYGVEKTQIAVL